MWKENITEIHPVLTKEEEEIVYRNIGNMLIDIYNKYILPEEEKNTN